MSRVVFNTVSNVWSSCMEKCAMYSQAQGLSFTTQAELEDLLRWTEMTTTDPVTMQPYPPLPGWFIWVAYRSISPKNNPKSHISGNLHFVPN